MSTGRIDLFLIGLALANLYAFTQFWIDKRAAVRGDRRIPERALLTAALFGGVGAWLGQQVLRHKTRKQPFRSQLSLIIAAHLAVVAAILWWLLD